MKWSVFWSALGALACSFSVSGEGTDSKAVSPFEERSILLGLHRGGRDQWPENTLVAFREAVERWPDALLELDVHATADGEVVVIHDDTVDRTTNGSGMALSMTLEELRALDAAYHFTADGGKTYPYRGKGVVIPTLREILEISPTHRFLIEMKDGDNIAGATVNAIREAGAANRCILAAVPPIYIQEARALAPEIATCYDFLSAATLLNELRYGDWDAYTPEHKMLALSPSLKKRFDLTPEEIAAIRTKGILVAFWTINKEEEMRLLLEIGVDSILTDRPDALAAILAERNNE
ncbi:MAG TPA: glycerophosphodiester phosphodiesterase [Candidatus Hydrogenedentes bacterium]|nr:glycerophosphodiester phosphodiesterase [Candidatus Hydrogenedentota bacterium]